VKECTVTKSNLPTLEELIGSSPQHVFTRDQEGRFAAYRKTFLDELARDAAGLEKLLRENASPPSP